MITMSFDEYNWHDSLLLNINIDRKDPGVNDTIELTIKWYGDGYSRIVFREVFLFKANMNFGIEALESIDAAYIASPDDVDLLDFYRGWKGAYDHFVVNCYIIRTASTGSEIKILATEYEVLDY